MKPTQETGMSETTEPGARARGYEAIKGGESAFWARVHQDGPDECWPWRLSCTADGYGRFAHSQRVEGAHRAAWMFHHRQDVPPGMVVMHECDRPWCCNPKHLRIGTQAQNVADREEKGRSSRGRRPAVTQEQRPDVIGKPGAANVAASERAGRLAAREALVRILDKKAKRVAKRKSIPGAGWEASFRGK